MNSTFPFNTCPTNNFNTFAYPGYTPFNGYGFNPFTNFNGFQGFQGFNGFWNNNTTPFNTFNGYNTFNPFASSFGYQNTFPGFFGQNQFNGWTNGVTNSFFNGYPTAWTWFNPTNTFNGFTPWNYGPSAAYAQFTSPYATTGFGPIAQNWNAQQTFPFWSYQNNGQPQNGRTTTGNPTGGFNPAQSFRDAA